MELCQVTLSQVVLSMVRRQIACHGVNRLSCLCAACLTVANDTQRICEQSLMQDDTENVDKRRTFSAIVRNSSTTHTQRQMAYFYCACVHILP